MLRGPVARPETQAHRAYRAYKVSRVYAVSKASKEQAGPTALPDYKEQTVPRVSREPQAAVLRVQPAAKATKVSRAKTDRSATRVSRAASVTKDSTGRSDFRATSATPVPRDYKVVSVFKVYKVPALKVVKEPRVRPVPPATLVPRVLQEYKGRSATKVTKAYKQPLELPEPRVQLVTPVVRALKVYRARLAQRV